MIKRMIKQGRQLSTLTRVVRTRFGVWWRSLRRRSSRWLPHVAPRAGLGLVDAAALAASA
jgi:hypothetical protein